MSYWDFARSPVSVRLLLDFAQARGIATSALLRGTRLTPALLADPDFAVSARQELQVARALLARLGLGQADDEFLVVLQALGHGHVPFLDARELQKAGDFSHGVIP